MCEYLVDGIPGKAAEEIEEEARLEVAESDEVAIIDNAVGVEVAVGDEEADDDIDKKGELSDAVEHEQIFRQASEEAELQGCEEGRVDCP